MLVNADTGEELSSNDEKLLEHERVDENEETTTQNNFTYYVVMKAIPTGCANMREKP